MACASYLQRREGRYSVQIRFSTAVAGLIGKPLYRASLKTTCYREAKLRLVEVLAWFHRMNDSIDYPSLFAKNVRTLDGYLKDEWPISSERLVARQRYEELLKNFRRRAEAAGFVPGEVDPEFHQMFAQFVRQNVEAEAWQRQVEREDAYERGRSEGRAAARATSAPASFGGAWGQKGDTAVEAPETEFISAPAVGTSTGAAPVEKATVPLRMSDALQAYVKDREKAKANRDGITNDKLIIQFLIDEMDDPFTETLRTSDLKRIDEMLPEIPNRKNVPKAYVGSLHKRYQYAQQSGWEGLIRLTEARLKQYHNSLSKFFGWLIKEGHFTDDKPVFNVLSDENLVSLERDSFREDEVLKIIRQPLFTGCKTETRIWKPGEVFVQSHIYWGYVLLLLTGMRTGEPGILETSDIELRDGIYYLHLRPFDPAKGRVARGKVRRFKTASSQRMIPLHPLIIDLGLLDRIRDLQQMGCPYLFPEWEPYPKPNGELRWGQPMTKSWQYLKRKVDLDRPDLTIYSTRHWFAQLIDGTDIKDRTRRRLMGHKDPSDSAHRYGSKTHLTARDLHHILNVESSTIAQMSEILLQAKERADASKLQVIKPWRDRGNWSSHYRNELGL